MENTPTVRASDLPTILGIVKNDPKSVKCKHFFPAAGFRPKQDHFCCLPVKAPANPSPTTPPHAEGGMGWGIVDGYYDRRRQCYDLSQSLWHRQTAV